MSGNCRIETPQQENKNIFYGNVALFSLGEIVTHARHGYRGLIYDVDAVFSQSDSWYDMMASSKPRKDMPWYHILVDGEKHSTYVPQSNLMLYKDQGVEINHPLVTHFFDQTSSGIFLARKFLN